MKEISRHNYEKRIKELTLDVDRLISYRRVCINIYDGIVGVVSENKTINQGWILKQIGELLK